MTCLKQSFVPESTLSILDLRKLLLLPMDWTIFRAQTFLFLLGLLSLISPVLCSAVLASVVFAGAAGVDVAGGVAPRVVA
jgi:hypothetical protein